MLDRAATQMRAWRCHGVGEHHALRIETLSAPTPGDGELHVDVRAFAPGFPDLLMVQGLYQLKPALPFTPCAEFSGTVRALGSGTRTTRSAWTAPGSGAGTDR